MKDFCIQPRWSQSTRFTLLPKTIRKKNPTRNQTKIYETIVIKSFQATKDNSWEWENKQGKHYNCPRLLPYWDYQSAAQWDQHQAEWGDRAKNLGRPGWPEFAGQTLERRQLHRNLEICVGFPLKYSAWLTHGMIESWVWGNHSRLEKKHLRGLENNTTCSQELGQRLFPPASNAGKLG